MTGIKWSQWITAGDLVVDVGANVGGFVGPFLDAGAEVLAFEPDVRTADRCRATYPKASVRAVAIGEEVGVTEFVVCSPGFSTQNSRFHGNTPLEKHGKSERQSVPMTTLDVALNGRIPCGIKIDTQGGDGWVVVGAQETMRRMKPGAWMLMELWPQGMKEAGFDIGRLVPLCSGWDPVAYGKSYVETTETLPALVQTMWNWPGQKHTNVLLRKK